MTIVDTHAHIYHADETRYPMIDKPYRPQKDIGTIAHLHRDMEEAGVGRVVLVQTGSAYRWDNRLLVDTALANCTEMVGVCNLNSGDGRSAHELERLVTQHNVRGLRLEPTQDGEARYYHDESIRLFEMAQRLGIVICAHIHVQLASELSELLTRFPDVPVVLDHSAYLQGTDAPHSDRLQTVLELARFKNLYTKLTFGVTGSSEEYPFRDTHPVIRQIIDGFGPDRCMWGSDFPCEHWLKKATYSEHLMMFTEEMDLSETEQTAILSETPLRLWFGR